MKRNENFEMAYQKHKREIYVFIFRMLMKKSESVELNHDVFIALFHELESDRLGLLQIRSWLYRVARNKALNKLRSRERESKAMRSFLVSESLRTSRNPEQDYSKEQERILVYRALKKMKERDAFLLQLYGSDLSYGEIAEVVGVEPSSVGKLLMRAKKKFKNLYQAEPKR